MSSILSQLSGRLTLRDDSLREAERAERTWAEKIENDKRRLHRRLEQRRRAQAEEQEARERLQSLDARLDDVRSCVSKEQELHQSLIQRLKAQASRNTSVKSTARSVPLPSPGSSSYGELFGESDPASVEGEYEFDEEPVRVVTSRRPLTSRESVKMSYSSSSSRRHSVSTSNV